MPLGPISLRALLRASLALPVAAVVSACAGSTTAAPTGGLALAAGPGGAAGASVSHAEGPTWYADVEPIVQGNCVACHQPQGMNLGGMVAPMSFASYESAKPWARVMALMVEQGKMPPWHAHPMHKGTFVGERYLEEADRETIIAWAEAGAPEGNPADSRTYVSAREGDADKAIGTAGDWWIGEPDLVMAFGEPFQVSDDIRDLNIGVNLAVPADYTEAKWIKASEMRAGTHHVHHICGEPFGCIAPGWDPYVYPDGFAMLLPPVKEIRLGMHYNKPTGPGTGFEDVSRAAVIFYDDGDTIRHMVRRTALSVGNDFVIPAGHPEFSISREFAFEEDTYILSLTPHMHYRGKKAKYELIHPDGRTELLLYVPEYDFEWQRMYLFKDPPVAPAGSKLIWTPTWDNSTDNEYNPDATIDVPYGAPTEMEMGNGWLDYTPVKAMTHVVGRDAIPEELLEEVTRQLRESAEREQVPVIDGVRRDGGVVDDTAL